MNRTILIPVVGTIAAIVAILVFRQEREAEPAPRPQPRVEAPPPTFGPDVPPPPPAPAGWSFRVEADGTLSDADSGESYGTPAETLEAIAPEGEPRPKVVLGPADGVTAEQLEQAAAALRERCDVRVFRRGQ